MALTLTKRDFDLFWDEVLGKDWYIDEWLTDQGDDIDVLAPGETFTIKEICLAWQGEGLPEPTKWISRRQLGDGLNFFALFEAWKTGQPTVTVSFTVDADRADEVIAAVAKLGGKRIA